MAKPFVSVLIDTYNHERFIEKAIVSVLEQDFPAGEREILVVDTISVDLAERDVVAGGGGAVLSGGAAADPFFFGAQGVGHPVGDDAGSARSPGDCVAISSGRDLCRSAGDAMPGRCAGSGSAACDFLAQTMVPGFPGEPAGVLEEVAVDFGIGLRGAAVVAGTSN